MWVLSLLSYRWQEMNVKLVRMIKIWCLEILRFFLVPLRNFIYLEQSSQFRSVSLYRALFCTIRIEVYQQYSQKELKNLQKILGGNGPKISWCTDRYASVTVRFQLLTPGTDPLVTWYRVKILVPTDRGRFMYQYLLGSVCIARTGWYTSKLRTLIWKSFQELC